MEQQGLDRSTVIGILLISLILLVWMLNQTPRPEDVPPTGPTEEVTEAEVEPDDDVEAAAALSVPTDSLFARATGGEAREIVVETDRTRATLSTRGGTLRSVQLLNYTHAVTGETVELVSDSLGALALGFSPPTGDFVDTRSLTFRPVVDG
ncbi:MAG: YidC/Oxa1 family insertase periplasmic-domain containing protein, partial [Bacteroidota bacterium]